MLEVAELKLKIDRTVSRAIREKQTRYNNWIGGGGKPYRTDVNSQMICPIQPEIEVIRRVGSEILKLVGWNHMKLCLGDIVEVGPNLSCLVEFLAGGRVGLASESITLIEEGSVKNLKAGMYEVILSRHLGMWRKFANKRQDYANPSKWNTQILKG